MRRFGHNLSAGLQEKLGYPMWAWQRYVSDTLMKSTVSSRDIMGLPTKNLISSSTNPSNTGWGRAAPRMMIEFEQLRRVVIQVQKRQMEKGAVHSKKNSHLWCEKLSALSGNRRL
jgi:hypothetical protein